MTKKIVLDIWGGCVTAWYSPWFTPATVAMSTLALWALLWL